MVLPATALRTVPLRLRQIYRQRRVDQHYPILDLHLFDLVDGLPLCEFEVDHAFG